MKTDSLFRNIEKDEEICELIRKGNDNLGVLGITDHSEKHTKIVAKRAEQILKEFGYDKHCRELAMVAGYMHDIGNAINRDRHAEYGGILAFEILKKYEITLEDRIEIVSCISNHDESTGRAFNPVSAALIIADKSDVRRERVRTRDRAAFDIHDRVNYAVTQTKLIPDAQKKVITLELSIDEESCTMYEYFDIFLGRMQMCRHAAEIFGARFKLMANGSKIL